MNINSKINNGLKRLKKFNNDRQSMNLLFNLKQREFSFDSNNNTTEWVEQAFAPRKAKLTEDIAILNRISEAYNKAKAVQKMAEPYYQVSNEWLPIYNSSLKEVMAALEKKDLEKLGRIYQNFMRNQCSAGLVGLPVDMNKCYFSGNISNKNKKLYLYDSLNRFWLWRNLTDKTYDIQSLDSPDIGNPFGYYIDGHFIKTGSDYQHYYATTIGRLTESNEHRFVVELGGGYGGVAYYLIRDCKGLTYLDFDLPENLALTTYYLLSAFPDKKFLLFGEEGLTDCKLSDYDLVLMPNFEIEKMTNLCADLVFNSYSLAEMSQETISNYVDIFNRIAKKYILHVNHTRNSLVSADDFGIDQHKFDLIYKIPALWNAGRNLYMDEYEYLYKRNEY
jgi:putative sugar O-methyltransferase